jgi:hypothetical protein
MTVPAPSQIAQPGLEARPLARYAGGLLGCPSHARLGLGRCRSWDTGRKARFDKENPGYWASALRMTGAMTPRGRSMVDHAKSCGLPAGRLIPLFTALRGAHRSVGALDVNKCVTQLHCEWTEQVATVCPIAGFTGLLQRRGRSA